MIEDFQITKVVNSIGTLFIPLSTNVDKCKSKDQQDFYKLILCGLGQGGLYEEIFWLKLIQKHSNQCKNIHLANESSTKHILPPNFVQSILTKPYLLFFFFFNHKGVTHYFFFFFYFFEQTAENISFPSHQFPKNLSISLFH